MGGYKTFLDECNKKYGEDAYVTDYDLENNGIDISLDGGIERTISVIRTKRGTEMVPITVRVFTPGELMANNINCKKVTNMINDIKNKGHFFKQCKISVEGDTEYRYYQGELKEI